MKNLITNLPPGKAAVIVGVSFITSAILVTLVDDLLLANFVIPGDTAALAKDIEADRKSFGLAFIGYLLVLVLDCIIGFALYVVLGPSNKKLALYTAVLRLLYAALLIIGLFALSFQIIDVYGYAFLKLVGYIFFALHLLVLGYAIFRSNYMPKSLGILLMFASLTYAVFFVDATGFPEALLVSVMLIMLLAELSLSIWLIVKRESLPRQ